MNLQASTKTSKILQHPLINKDNAQKCVEHTYSTEKTPDLADFGVNGQTKKIDQDKTQEMDQENNQCLLPDQIIVQNLRIWKTRKSVLGRIRNWPDSSKNRGSNVK